MRTYLRGCLAHETTGIAEILEAGSVRAAKSAVAEQSVDVIIAEYAEADAMGMELYRSLQSDDGSGEVPVILVMDEPIPAEVHRLRGPTLRVLTRPFNSSRLCDAVRRAVGMAEDRD